MAMVLRESAVLTALGLLIGLAAATALTRYLQAMLFGIAPLDPWTFASALVGFAIVSLLASYVPARRAVQVNPLTALRAE